MERYPQGDWALVLESHRCKGCELCVESCPRQVLALNERDKVVIVKLEDCIFCGLCELRCPDFAIWLEKPVVLAGVAR